MNFERIAQDPQSSARCGLLYTDHGVIETPIFMPVGTAAAMCTKENVCPAEVNVGALQENLKKQNVILE